MSVVQFQQPGKVQNSTTNKALKINLDERKYGTIAEIGAGQEVARHFFQAGAAAGTIAKTISAYDMQFSDAIYGTQDCGRYVSRSRVQAMLKKEFQLVIERVGESRQQSSRYFAYAATVSAKSFNRNNECHAWCGVFVQMYPGAEPSEIILHVRMRDNTAELQQECLGVLGVNLIYGAYYHFEDPKQLIASLTDNLDKSRLEIDAIEFKGAYFEDIDNREINLHLIRAGMTRAIMFKPDGNVAIPADMLYKKNVLTIRGSFKPVTRLNVDMIEQGWNSFQELPEVQPDNTLVLSEITLNDIHGDDLQVPESDLAVRIGLLNSLGYCVMISSYTRYFSLRAYLRQFTDRQIGIVLGMINIRGIFDEKTYQSVEGGILEGFGKLFPDNTRLYVYPELDEHGAIRDIADLRVADNLNHLYMHLLDNGFIKGIDCSDINLMKIYSRNILAQLPYGPGEWEQQLPEQTADTIVENRLFGYRPVARAA